MSSVKNYTEQGGERTIIGGILEITSDGKLILAEEELKQVEAQNDSAATTVATLKDDFNALLAKLRAAGFMAVD